MDVRRKHTYKDVNWRTLVSYACFSGVVFYHRADATNRFTVAPVLLEATSGCGKAKSLPGGASGNACIREFSQQGEPF